LVIETSLYYDARSEKHQIREYLIYTGADALNHKRNHIPENRNREFSWFKRKKIFYLFDTARNKSRFPDVMKFSLIT